jgi:hypothetical protein
MRSVQHSTVGRALPGENIDALAARLCALRAEIDAILDQLMRATPEEAPAAPEGRNQAEPLLIDAEISDWLAAQAEAPGELSSAPSEDAAPAIELAAEIQPGDHTIHSAFAEPHADETEAELIAGAIAAGQAEADAACPDDTDVTTCDAAPEGAAEAPCAVASVTGAEGSAATSVTLGEAMPADPSATRPAHAPHVEPIQPETVAPSAVNPTSIATKPDAKVRTAAWALTGTPLAEEVAAVIDLQARRRREERFAAPHAAAAVGRQGRELAARFAACILAVMVAKAILLPAGRADSEGTRVFAWRAAPPPSLLGTAAWAAGRDEATVRRP